LTILSVVNSGVNNDFILTAAGTVYHLNVIVPQNKMSISGTCGSACGSGNPAIQVDYSVVNGQYNGSATEFSCSSPWVFNWDGDSPNECGFNTNANTVLNTPLASSFQTDCDTFAPGTDCRPTYTFSITVVLTAGALEVFNNSNSCDCVWHRVWVGLGQSKVRHNNFDERRAFRSILVWRLLVEHLRLERCWNGAMVLGRSDAVTRCLR
jgi:hypothetical protein